MAVSAGRKARLIWLGLIAVVVIPLVAASQSPLLQWRDPVYIAASFAGILAMVLLVLQPVLAAGLVPGLRVQRMRQMHRYSGVVLVGAIVVHVGALWLTSPPDVVDALLFASPTVFSVWGVIAMWAIFATALLALLRRRLRLRPKVWRLAHTALALLIVAGSVLHMVLLQGTLGLVVKYGLGAIALAVLVKALVDLRLWALVAKGRG